ncbi:MAG: hypothetical protein ACT4QB_06515 [Gammaproteobacteria bacterium]
MTPFALTLNPILPRLSPASSRMAPIDRRAWVGGLSFGVHGVRIGIRVSDPGVLQRVADYLPPGFRVLPSATVDHLYSIWTGDDHSGSSDARFHRLYAGRHEVVRTLTMDDLLEHLESCLHHTVAAGARHKLFVHAGVVGWHGRAIVIPGASYSGKSSLVAELVRAGATYYSDEFAVFDRHGRVHPYRRRLSLRTGGTKTRHAVEAPEGRAGARSLPVGLIAITAYRPEAHWCPESLTPAQAVLALLSNTVVARIRPQLALSTLGRVVPRALALESKRGEARETVAHLLHEVATASRQPAYWQGQIAA